MKIEGKKNTTSPFDFFQFPTKPYLCTLSIQIPAGLFIPQMPTINGVLNRVVDELKQILKKDFNKKMVENTAFKLFDVWWDERKKTEKLAVIGTPSSSSTSVVVNNAVVVPNTEVVAAATAAAVVSATQAAAPVQPSTPTIVKEEPTKNQGLASLLEQATTPLGLNYDGFGLGIRASMPKMPSFRVSLGAVKGLWIEFCR